MSEGYLFGQEEQPRRRARKPATQPVPKLIEQYHTLYVERFKTSPLILGGKDAAALKRMVQTWGADTVSALLVEFMQGDDPWARKQGWTLASFAHVAPGMMTRGVHAHDARTADNIDAARRAMQRRGHGV